MFNNPFKEVFIITEHHKISNTNPNMLIPILKDKCRQLQEKMNASPCDKNTTYYFDDEIELSRQELELKNEYVDNVMNFDYFEYQLQTLEKLPFKSCPVIYAMLVPIAGVVVNNIYRKYNNRFVRSLHAILG
jgi:hypothetical protein